MAKNKSIDIYKYNIKLDQNKKNACYILIIFCLMALLFRRKLNINIERVLLFILILALLLINTKNWLISLIGSVILFLLFNLFLNIQKKNNSYIESFNNTENNKENNDKDKEDMDKKKEEIKKKIESSDFLNNIVEKVQDYQNNKDVKKAADGLQDLLSQLDGGIEIKKSDKEETEKLNVNPENFKDEDKPDPMRKAQKETYELINMVDSLKNTMETLSPVLSQGKEIMNMFENFKM